MFSQNGSRLRTPKIQGYGTPLQFGVTLLNAATMGTPYALSTTDMESTVIEITGVLPANTVIQIPAATDTTTRSLYLFRNLTTGAFTVTVQVGGGGANVVVTQNRSVYIMGTMTDAYAVTSQV